MVFDIEPHILGIPGELLQSECPLILDRIGIEPFVEGNLQRLDGNLRRILLTGRRDQFQQRLKRMAFKHMWILDRAVQIAKDFFLKPQILAKAATIINERLERFGAFQTFFRKLIP